MAEETISPARNFTIAVEDRVRALAGPPAYMRRKRAIEDLEELLLTRIGEYLRDGATSLEVTLAANDDGTSRDLGRLNELIDRHNRYYPMEANLPFHPRTGRMMERGGAPWTPLERWSLERLVATALQRI